MEGRALVTLSTCLVIVGCSRDTGDADAHARSAAKWQVPTAGASGPAPHPNVTNAAPLNNAAGYPERARTSSPNLRSSLASAGSERTATGHFVSAPGWRVSGEVVLQEIGTAVRAHLEVEGGQPGVRRIIFSDNADCAMVERNAAAAPEVRGAGLGALTIDEDGRGESTVDVPHANLRSGSDGSLVHGALLLYASERVAEAPSRREVPVACAKIASK